MESIVHTPLGVQASSPQAARMAALPGRQAVLSIFAAPKAIYFGTFISFRTLSPLS